MAVDILSTAQLEALIGCPKRVENTSARRRQDAQHYRLDYSARSETGDDAFVIFTRQNIRIADDYSAGLRWRSPSGEEVILVRCNGSSHRHSNALEAESFVDRCHAHWATERYASAGRRIDTYAQPVDAYGSLDGALHYLTRIANISGLDTTPDTQDLFKP